MPTFGLNKGNKLNKHYIKKIHNCLHFAKLKIIAMISSTAGESEMYLK